jgi:HlyD family secretion protein
MASPSISSAATEPQRPALEPVPPSNPRSNVWPFVFCAVVLILGLAAWEYRSAARSRAAAVPAVKTVKAVRGVLQHSVRVTGSVTARNFSNVFAPIVQAPDAGNRGLVLIHLATNGGMVKEGDLVATIDGQTVQDHLEDVESQVTQTELDMRSLRARQDSRREAMEQDVRVAKATLEKAQQDIKAAVVKTEIQRELLKLALEEAELSYRQIQSELALLSQRQAAEWRIAELGREGQVRHRNRHRADLARFTIRAPRDGQVILRSLYRNGEQTQVRQGDEVFPGMAFMKVVDLSDMQLDASISQAESELVRLGQKAVVRFDAYPGLILDGKVEAVGMMASSNRRVNYYVRRVPVRIALEGSDPRVIPDLTANADVVLNEVDDTLLIPREAVQETAGKAVVLVKQGDAVVAREVEIGGYSNTQASVISGLQEGDHVAVQMDKP